MREILFRGKRINNGEWIEGFYAHSGEKKYILIDNDIAVGYFAMKEVNPDTIGQYTGLTDNNGTKIFEGDILKANNGHIGWVIFRNGEFVKRCCCHPNSFNTIFYGDNETVVGNIYDNPELLRSDIE